MLSAIFCAIEEDNHSGLEELLDVANIDVNQSNKHGESGVHIAAGLGRLEMYWRGLEEKHLIIPEEQPTMM